MAAELEQLNKIVAAAKKLIAGVAPFTPDEDDILGTGRARQTWIINLSSQHDSLTFLEKFLTPEFKCAVAAPEDASDRALAERLIRYALNTRLAGDAMAVVIESKDEGLDAFATFDAVMDRFAFGKGQRWPSRRSRTSSRPPRARRSPPSGASSSSCATPRRPRAARAGGPTTPSAATATSSAARP